jgi:hypothetical protein
MQPGAKRACCPGHCGQRRQRRSSLTVSPTATVTAARAAASGQPLSHLWTGAGHPLHLKRTVLGSESDGKTRFLGATLGATGVNVYLRFWIDMNGG